MKNISVTKIIIIIASISFLTGCTVYQVSFPEGADRTKFSKYKVDGNNTTSNISDEKYSIGNYKVVVDRSMTSFSSSGSFFKLFETNVSKSIQQGYSFKIKGPDKYLWEGDCLAQVMIKCESERILGFEIDSKLSLINTLQCFLKSSGNKKFEIKMVETEIQEKVGEITGENLKLTFKSTKKLKSSKFDFVNLTGYYISNNNVVIAVIDIFDDSAVYIAEGVDKDTQALIFAGSAAILSYRDVKGTNDKKEINFFN